MYYVSNIFIFGIKNVVNYLLYIIVQYRKIFYFLNYNTNVNI